ncbi:MAG: glutathione S-transferase N-terminal domain-containing protein [Solirubrobacteraceae bacterium]|nr:glutathione S-transferase N-terminal domain-containing protein [Solirubrobacteraceae bacterium]
MRHTLHVINGSHPCAAVLRALELKGIDVRIVEYLPPFHPPIMKLKFGYRQIPVLVLEGGEVVRGSRTIMQRLEAIQPDPPLYPREHIQAIEEAERWGDEVLQMAARRLLWTAVAGKPRALASFQAGSKLPGLPGPIVGLMAPLVVAGERRLNGITPERVREHAATLPAMFDKLEEFHAAGAFGTALPTGADLQIGASLQLLRSIDDLRPLIDAHEYAREIARWLPPSPGRVPAGALSPELIALAVSG